MTYINAESFVYELLIYFKSN